MAVCQVMDSDAEGVPSEFFDYFKVIFFFLQMFYDMKHNNFPCQLTLFFVIACNFHMCLQVLCIQGFLTCRKHAERIILLVEMLQVMQRDSFHTHSVVNILECDIILQCKSLEPMNRNSFCSLSDGCIQYQGKYFHLID